MNDILVVATHPDDETLGCGGTLFNHKNRGDRIHWLIVTEQPNSGSNSSFFEQKKSEIKKICAFYDFDSVNLLSIPTTKVDEVAKSKLIDKISKVFCEVKPSVIYLPFCHDVHSDHRCVFDAAYSFTKSFRFPFIKEVYMMETLSETEFSPAIAGHAFTPNVFVNITSFIGKKIEAIQIYKSEIQEHPFPRSIENIKALALHRGATAGVKFAESFMLVKSIINQEKMP